MNQETIKNKIKGNEPEKQEPAHNLIIETETGILLGPIKAHSSLRPKDVPKHVVFGDESTDDEYICGNANRDLKMAAMDKHKNVIYICGKILEKKNKDGVKVPYFRISKYAVTENNPKEIEKYADSSIAPDKVFETLANLKK